MSFFLDIKSHIRNTITSFNSSPVENKSKQKQVHFFLLIQLSNTNGIMQNTSFMQPIIILKFKYSQISNDLSMGKYRTILFTSCLFFEVQS